MKNLSGREEEIMELFWEKGAMYVKDLIDELNDPKPHFNTISTIVRRLEEKGFVGHEQFGNAYRYFANISREEYSRSTMGGVVSKYFNKSYASVISMFVKEENISLEEIKELIRQVESQKAEDNG